MCERILFFFLLTIVTNNGDIEIAKVMKELAIIPDVIDRPPKEVLKVTYQFNVIVDEGAELTPIQVKDEPIVDYTADENTLYTLIMLSPDMPDRQNPYWREWLHWLVTNIPGTDVEQGGILCPYIGALVPKSAGLLRFVFLVFQQSENISFDEEPLSMSSADGHMNFSTRSFTDKYGLGNPIAGNAFQARWDEYVPVLEKYLNIKL